MDWYFKKHSTAETDTYGYEFVSTRTCVEHIIYLSNTLWYLGVPTCQKSYMFGDNKYIVGSDIHPHAMLHKCHTALSFHRVREAIASNIVAFYHVYGWDIPAYIILKHWVYTNIWRLLQPLLFWMGDTMELLDLELRRDGGQEKGEW